MHVSTHKHSLRPKSWSHGYTNPGRNAQQASASHQCARACTTLANLRRRRESATVYCCNCIVPSGCAPIPASEACAFWFSGRRSTWPCTPGAHMAHVRSCPGLASPHVPPLGDKRAHASTSHAHLYHAKVTHTHTHTHTHICITPRTYIHAMCLRHTRQHLYQGKVVTEV